MGRIRLNNPTRPSDLSPAGPALADAELRHCPGVTPACVPSLTQINSRVSRCDSTVIVSYHSFHLAIDRTPSPEAGPATHSRR
jgi:hypothetical protein